jgi:hypothetical protein
MGSPPHNANRSSARFCRTRRSDALARSGGGYSPKTPQNDDG